MAASRSINTSASSSSSSSTSSNTRTRSMSKSLSMSMSISNLILLSVLLISSSSSSSSSSGVADAFVLDTSKTAVVVASSGRVLFAPTPLYNANNGLNNNDASLNGPSGPPNSNSRYVNNNNNSNSNSNGQFPSTANGRRYMAHNSHSDMIQEADAPISSSNSLYSRKRTPSSAYNQENNSFHNTNINSRRPATFQDKREGLIRSNDLIRSVSPMQSNHNSMHQSYRQTQTPSTTNAAPDTPWERRSDSPSYETARRSSSSSNAYPNTNHRESVRRPAHQSSPWDNHHHHHNNPPPQQQQRTQHFPRPNSPYQQQQRQNPAEQSLVRTPRRRPTSNRRVMDPFRRHQDDFHNTNTNNNFYNGNRAPASNGQRHPSAYNQEPPASPLHPLELEVQQLRKQLQAKGAEHEKLLECLLEVNDNLERALRMASAAVADAKSTTTSTSTTASTASSTSSTMYSYQQVDDAVNGNSATTTATTATVNGDSTDSTDDAATKNANALQTLCDGIQLTQNTLDKAFEQGKLEKYGKEGDEFDPKYHSALFDFSDPTRVPGTIGHVIKDGYIIKNGNANHNTHYYGNAGVNGNGTAVNGNAGVNGNVNGDGEAEVDQDRVLRYAEVSVVKEE